MIKQSHHINQLALHLQVSNEVMAAQHQDAFADLIKKEVISKMAKLLDRFSQPNEMIRINQLNIDLGSIQLDKNAQYIGKQILELIEKEINKIVRSENTELVKIRSLASDKMDALINYLEKGYLPWSYRSMDLNEAVREFIRDKKNDFLKSLSAAFDQTGIAVVQRILRQLDQRNVYRISIGLIDYSNVHELRKTVKLIVKYSRHLSKDQRFQLWDSLLAFMLSNESQKIKYQKHFLAFLDTDSENKELSKKIKALLNIQSEQFKSNEVQPETDMSSPVANEKLFVQNAGIVLLHPFLSRYFQVLSLTKEEGVFVNDKERQKAVYLLHYLATGNIDVEEQQLVFQKKMCGLLIGMPLTVIPEITDTVRIETENLLQAVIQHWTALGNISVEGLRESFLQREGQLAISDEAWLLEVEKKPFDILLDRLPWGIGLIKLKWMPAFGQVNWTG